MTSSVFLIGDSVSQKVQVRVGLVQSPLLSQSITMLVNSDHGSARNTNALLLLVCVDVASFDAAHNQYVIAHSKLLNTSTLIGVECTMYFHQLQIELTPFSSPSHAIRPASQSAGPGSVSVPSR